MSTDTDGWNWLPVLGCAAAEVGSLLVGCRYTDRLRYNYYTPEADKELHLSMRPQFYFNLMTCQDYGFKS